jgi:hypothetical protein
MRNCIVRLMLRPEISAAFIVTPVLYCYSMFYTDDVNTVYTVKWQCDTKRYSTVVSWEWPAIASDWASQLHGRRAAKLRLVAHTWGLLDFMQL